MPSTAIRHFKYDDAKAELLVTFITGRRYAYFDVPSSIAVEFKAALSKGTFFNTRIRDHFTYRELEDVTR